jgi:tRNA threonylcarbamoyladenosine biosynthesis protein TsaE
MSDPADPVGATLRLHLVDPEATQALGRRLGECLRVGQGLALVGDLGAGKTCLARGVGRGLELDDPDGVCSPTYLLVVEHAGPAPMIHVDAYLPEKTRAFLEDGGLDYLDETPGVIVVEWADRLQDLLPDETLWVTLLPAGGEDGVGREVVIEDRTHAFPWLDSAWVG